MTDTPVIDHARLILIDPPVADAVIIVVIIPVVSVDRPSICICSYHTTIISRY
jgi:hypothetical protein